MMIDLYDDFSVRKLFSFCTREDNLTQLGRKSVRTCQIFLVFPLQVPMNMNDENMFESIQVISNDLTKMNNHHSPDMHLPLFPHTCYSVNLCNSPKLASGIQTCRADPCWKIHENHILFTNIHTYIHACMHACIHAYMHTCIHAYMYIIYIIYILYIYIHVCI